MGEILLSEKDLMLIGAVYNVRPYIIEQVDPDTHEPIKTPYCFQCGNLANALMVDYHGLLTFYRPICGNHAWEKVDKEDFQWLGKGKTIANRTHHRNHEKLLRDNCI